MSNATDVEYVRVKKSDFDLRYKHVGLTAMDIEVLIEHTDTIKKWINECMYHAQNGLSGLKFVGKEGEAYSMIAIGDKLKLDLDNTQKKYREYITDLSEGKIEE